ncbi:MAG TPA: beta-N-acetylhexosaminidase [Bdellovibrionota bacterium]|nr:beta-N-acetylhexosaminidase [Bdellovibrionota bacterium]
MKNVKRVLDEIGQLLVIGLSGPRLMKEERVFIRRVAPGGVIYFRRNVKSPTQLRSLARSVWSLFPKDRPPFIGIDQEGGRVARLGPPFTLFPGNDYLGRIYRKTKSLSLIQAQAQAMAKELKAIGVNLNFTPVADIDTNPRNPVIGPRAFGKNPKDVARLVATTVKAYKKERVICCAKHFPGHGDTSKDSHKVLPIVRASRPTLFRRELLPFESAVRAGVPTIMTAHVVYPSLDRALPATLSKFILDRLLRRKLHFDGVAISDDLEMNAIVLHSSISEAALNAIRAGVDLLLVCKSLSEARQVHLDLSKAVLWGQVSVNRIAEALNRIRKVKKRYLSGGPGLSLTSVPRNGWRKHQKLAEVIKEKGKQELLVSA